MGIQDLLARLAADEQTFLKQEFLAPAMRSSTVQVRISGVIMQMKILPEDFEGWGVFSPVDHESAVLVRQATRAQQRDYLKLTPSTSVILCNRAGNRWQAIAAHADGRFQIDSPVDVQLVEDADLFDSVKVGFDGNRFWFQQIDLRADAPAAAWLRNAAEEKKAPNALERKGLTPQMRAAYAIHHFGRLHTEQEVRQNEVETQLREALEHAGAGLVGYVEHKSGFRVTYTIAGKRHVSSVNKKDLSVQVAGICLSGQDRKFDLTSLVGVMRGTDARYVPRVGQDGMSEQDYWDIHPPN